MCHRISVRCQKKLSIVIITNNKTLLFQEGSARGMTTLGFMNAFGVVPLYPQSSNTKAGRKNTRNPRHSRVRHAKAPSNVSYKPAGMQTILDNVPPPMLTHNPPESVSLLENLNCHDDASDRPSAPRSETSDQTNNTTTHDVIETLLRAHHVDMNREVNEMTTRLERCMSLVESRLQACETNIKNVQSFIESNPRKLHMDAPQIHLSVPTPLAPPPLAPPPLPARPPPPPPPSARAPPVEAEIPNQRVEEGRGYLPPQYGFMEELKARVSRRRLLAEQPPQPPEEQQTSSQTDHLEATTP